MVACRAALLLDTTCSMERRVIEYRGRVQGVGFRATTRRVARGFGVTGWARNEPDGSVRVEVQGMGAEIEAFVAALGVAMERNIASCAQREMNPVDGERAFEVRYR